jgi:hypothetical protein
MLKDQPACVATALQMAGLDSVPKELDYSTNKQVYADRNTIAGVAILA